MRYYHRTSVSPDQVMDEAERYFGRHLDSVQREARNCRFSGRLGTVTIAIRPEGGHHVHVTAATDQVGESELDKLTKRFLGLVHQIADPTHEVRGAY